MERTEKLILQNGCKVKEVESGVWQNRIKAFEAEFATLTKQHDAQLDAACSQLAQREASWQRVLQLAKERVVSRQLEISLEKNTAPGHIEHKADMQQRNCRCPGVDP
eukprot:TRINITY_DN68177_c7_g5_i1.p1 TRINITY_DN68177_c7_g5~~TRINITY_DN68177_c7_g5_i1.p1  ORF type:complete len:107 (-),score=21.25 TRINITY_DN68177_c7_g5_i1:258-578(-)